MAFFHFGDSVHGSEVGAAYEKSIGVGNLQRMGNSHVSDLRWGEGRDHRGMSAGKGVCAGDIKVEFLKKLGLGTSNVVRIGCNHKEAPNIHRTKRIDDRRRGGNSRNASRPLDAHSQFVRRLGSAEETATGAGRHDNPDVNFSEQFGLHIYALHHLHKQICTHFRPFTRQAREMRSNSHRHVTRKFHLASDIPLRH